MTIYVDMLLALNWWIDFLLLLGVRHATGGGETPWRMAMGALVGAATCFTLFLPPLPVWLTLLIRLLSAAVMITVAFGVKSYRHWLRRMVMLFAFSAALAGLCGALYFFIAPTGFYMFNGIVYYAVSPLLLVVLTMAVYGLLWLSEQWLLRKAPHEHLFRVQLCYDERQVEFRCLYDSGNHLIEPFSGRPVLVIEHRVAGELLSVVPTVENLPPGWRLIPYDTLGGEGLLPAFAPTAATILRRGQAYPLPPCYIAVCERLGNGEYSGLMGADMGDDLMRKGGREVCFTN